MTHEHGSEYQVRIVHEDEMEQLSGWMNRPEEVAQALTGLRGSPAKAYWLQVRNILCLNCLHSKLTIVKFRLSLTAAENTRFPRQTDRRPFGSASSRTSSTGASGRSTTIPSNGWAWPNGRRADRIEYLKSL